MQQPKNCTLREDSTVESLGISPHSMPAAYMNLASLNHLLYFNHLWMTSKERRWLKMKIKGYVKSHKPWNDVMIEKDWFRLFEGSLLLRKCQKLVLCSGELSHTITNSTHVTWKPWVLPQIISLYGHESFITMLKYGSIKYPRSW